jgi:hypothetical protein
MLNMAAQPHYFSIAPESVRGRSTAAVELISLARIARTPEK